MLSLAVLSAYSIDDKKLKENIGQSRHLTELMVDEEYAKRQKALAEERRAKIEQETERTAKPRYNMITAQKEQKRI